jgi:hypothetical protein
MFPRSLTAPALLAASIGVPYVASNAPQWSEQVRGGSPPPIQAAAADGANSLAPLASTTAQTANPFADPAATGSKPSALKLPQGPGANLFPTQIPLEGAPTYSIADVLRMDVSKEWVYLRWPRKSTALAELELFGVRVPLVTGTRLHDLAGSLTYYFGADGRVKRISFHGRTGDTTQLAAIVHQRFGLQAIPTAISGEQLLQARNGDDLISELRTRPAPVLWASTPHESFAVELELQDPAAARPLPQPGVPTPTAAASPARATPTASASAATPGPAAGSSISAPPAAIEKSEPLGWKAFFPRSRLPSGQVENLDQGNLYQ